MRIPAFIALSIFACSCVVSAQEAAQRTAAVDRNFIVEAGSAGAAEVALGRLAQKNGSSESVKRFGSQMVADHGKSSNELAALAKTLGVDMPSGPTGKHLEAIRRLENLKGVQFDQVYAQQMIADHVATVGLYEKQEKTGNSAELKAFVTRTLPTLREHLNMAQALLGASK